MSVGTRKASSTQGEIRHAQITECFNGRDKMNVGVYVWELYMGGGAVFVEQNYILLNLIQFVEVE